jgi:Glycosyltransferase
LKNIFFHDHYGNIKNNQTIDFITKYIIRKSIYIGVSKELCRWSLDKCGVKQTYQLNNIILKEKIVKKSHFKKEGIRLLIVSNIHPRKNIEFAIEIMYELIKNGEYYLDILGQITDRTYFIKLSNLISSFGIEDHVSFNSNCISTQQILHRYDLALHPSKSETGPLVLIEYIAQSLPFITFDTGEVVQQIKNELPMLIINNFEIVKWLDKINTLLNYDRKLFKEKMEKIYSHNYSSEKYYSRCLNIYQKNLFSHHFRYAMYLEIYLCL